MHGESPVPGNSDALDSGASAWLRTIETRYPTDNLMVMSGRSWANVMASGITLSTS
jgi:hypothetical protein